MKFGWNSTVLICDCCFFALRMGIYVYLSFVFKSLETFLLALREGDEPDGEHFDYKSRTKSEKACREQHGEKPTGEEKNNNKTEQDKVNEQIELKMQKYKDFEQLKKPNTKKETPVYPQILGDLPSFDSVFM